MPLPEETGPEETGSETLHATTVAIGERAVLILGASGAGKSDLALRLIDRGAVLVADDHTVVRREGAVLYAHCPATIAGKIEVRGVGICDMPHRQGVAVAMAVRLSDTVERMPDDSMWRIAGVDVCGLTLDPREPSAPMKVELAMRRLPSWVLAS